ncbi:FG-GAP repeat protein [Lysobacter tyrosinilyticus]
MLLLAVMPTAMAALDYNKLLLPNVDMRSDVVAGDLNGDGRDDIVVSELSHPRRSQPGYNGRIHVYLQRPSGNFDFALVYECGCNPVQLRLIGNPSDNRKRVLFRSLLDGFTQPNLPKGGFTVLEVRAGGTLEAFRYVEGYLLDQGFSLVDINQDGREDLFFTYVNDDNTRPGVDSTYRIWYGSAVTERTADGRIAPLSRFRDYQGPQFMFSGMDPNWPFTQSVADRVDIDGDGLSDAILGLCPTDCLFQQQPYGKLEATPLSYDAMSSGMAGFGDLDGDGLPEEILSSNSYHEDVKVFLQASPKAFSLVGTIGPYFSTAWPMVADLDNNGLNDIAFTGLDETENTPTPILNAWLQVSPGQFAVDREVIGHGGEHWQVRDLNRDGCSDLLTLGRYGAYFLRGRGCGPAADLEVRASTAGRSATVEVLHRYGPRSFLMPRVRVMVAPASPGSRALTFSVTAPPGCTAVAAEAPRRMFDCVLATLQPGQRVALPFTIDLATGNAIPLSMTAFLLDGGGDLDPDNNRAQVRSTFTPLPSRQR